MIKHIFQPQRPNQLLGELQMAFLCFLVGEVYSAFEHWKKLVNIFCSADKFLLKDSELILEFIEDLYFQVSYSSFFAIYQTN